MAKRDENLKKINDELEKLSDEELEKVAGGLVVFMAVGDMKKDPDGNSQNQQKYVGCPH